MKIDHEIVSTVNFSHQEGQMAVSGDRMCTSTGKPFKGLSLARKSVVE